MPDPIKIAVSGIANSGRTGCRADRPDEAAGLRAELDARKQWGLWRRVRGR